MKKLLITLLIIPFMAFKLTAKEGMWLPMLLKNLNEADMQAMGLKLSAEDIYSINQSSLKDAVISFGGFCTGEIISDQGLILTNHHCGYGQIQSHSSVEKDYLTDGFWAMNKDEELTNPGLTATFIVRMEDVTDKLLSDIDPALKEGERQSLIKQRIDSLVKVTTKDSHYGAYIKPFFYGNEYYMFVTETFKDIRLVGAPPSSIGKFGGDTDNWMWPRHTGDFSLFRIYADSNNMPAEYSENNVPYKPKHYFPISMKGVQEGDFTMVYGFPGRTQEYLTSYAIQQIKEVINPAQISIREVALEIMDKRMKASDEIRIKYASKYARISNYWKKWIGENRGLEKSNAIALKQKKEQAFLDATKGMKEYEDLLTDFKVKYDVLEPYALARSYFIEIPYQKIEITQLASRFRAIVSNAQAGKAIDSASVATAKKRVKNHFKDYDLDLDKELTLALLMKYKEETKDGIQPKVLKQSKADLTKAILKMYEKSVFAKESDLLEILDNPSTKGLAKLATDPAYEMMNAFWTFYTEKIRPTYVSTNHQIESLSKIYVKGMREHVPGKYYPDANSTLRLAYGKVEDYEPKDAVQYDFYTNTEGILEKYQAGHADFDLPQELIDLIEAEDYGPYSDQDGSMHVCFTASNHSTGGNSGSPVLNANGELIGLNFDRNWEGTMSDINYDINQCRNISVDIRYVLFVVDKYAKATHLIQEMKLITKAETQ